MKKIDINTLSYSDILAGSKKYVKYEKRDAVYKVATFLVGHFWYKPPEIADAVGTLLLIWNQAHYRYCNFDLDFQALEGFLVKNETSLIGLRQRSISTYDLKRDGAAIKNLFNDMLIVLRCAKRKSPVAVSKALHLLAPDFFPIWDNDIAMVHSCYWYYSDDAARKYLEFMEKMKVLSERIISTYRQKNGTDRETARAAICKGASSNVPFMKSLLKVIDEYNYSYTKYSKRP